MVQWLGGLGIAALAFGVAWQPLETSPYSSQDVVSSAGEQDWALEISYPDYARFVPMVEGKEISVMQQAYRDAFSRQQAPHSGD
jgi:hypothetical protein